MFRALTFWTNTSIPQMKSKNSRRKKRNRRRKWNNRYQALITNLSLHNQLFLNQLLRPRSIRTQAATKRARKRDQIWTGIRTGKPNQLLMRFRATTRTPKRHRSRRCQFRLREILRAWNQPRIPPSQQVAEWPRHQATRENSWLKVMPQILMRQGLCQTSSRLSDSQAIRTSARNLKTLNQIVGRILRLSN